MNSQEISRQYESPNDLAVSNSQKIVNLLRIKPNSTHTSVEGGVLLHFKTEQKEAYIECYNDGEIGYTLLISGKIIKSFDASNYLVMTDYIQNVEKHLAKAISC